MRDTIDGMQRLHYTGDTVLVPDPVCEALLDYASALADSQGSAVITIPVFENGTLTYAEILLGPASQLYSTHAEGVEDVDVDQAIVDDIRLRARKLRPSEVHPMSESPDQTYDFDIE